MRKWCLIGVVAADGASDAYAGDAVNGCRVWVADQVAVAASLCCLGLTPRTRLNAVLSA
jgi:hypothetical protein